MPDKPKLARVIIKPADATGENFIYSFVVLGPRGQYRVDHRGKRGENMETALSMALATADSMNGQ